jgi:peptide methionine sulfoxide reductase msrA/msrB
MLKLSAAERVIYSIRLLVALVFFGPMLAISADEINGEIASSNKKSSVPSNVPSSSAGSAARDQQKLATAIFAGGCFWCMEPPFEKLKGVKAVESGYTGGHVENPTYEQVSYKETGHYEAVRVTYDPAVVSYQKLLDVFWRQVDPTDPNGQFVDQGSSYRTAIFYDSEVEKTLAEKSKAELAKSARFGKPIVTPVLPAKTFWLAEDYHQDYYKKNSVRYKFYRFRSGRDQFLEKHWGKDAKK